MKAKKLFVVLILVAVGVCVSTIGFSTTTALSARKIKRPEVSGATAPREPAKGSEQSPQAAKAPEYVVYRQFFKHVLALKEHAAKIEAEGKNGIGFRTHYKSKIGLTDSTVRSLEKIAEECNRDVAELDARAQEIIRAARNDRQNGRLSHGQAPPPVPRELKRMQLQKNLLITQARDRLRLALGEQEFQKVNDFIRVNFAPDVKPAQISRQP